MVETQSQQRISPAQPPARTSPDIPSARRGAAHYILFLGLVLLMAAAVRFYGLGGQDYWFDELYSLSFSAGKKADFAALPFGEIIHEFDLSTEIDESTSVRTIAESMRAVDTHPPVYFVLLWWWRTLVGESEFAVRSLSAIFSFLSVVVLWGIFAAMGRPRAGLFACAINALAYSHIFVGQQNRHYSLSVLLSCVSIWLFVLGEKHWGRRGGRGGGWASIALAVAFAVSAYLAVLTHYFSGLALLGLAVYAFARLRGRALAIWFSASAIAAIAAAATWLPSLLDQVAVIKAQRWLIDPVANHREVTILRFLDLPVRLLMWVDETTPNWSRAMAGVAVALAAGAVLVWKRERQALLFAMWFLVPAVFMFLVDFPTDKQTLFPLRYPVIATSGLIGLLALAIDALARLRRAPLADHHQPPWEEGGRPREHRGPVADEVANPRAGVAEQRAASLVALGALLVVMAFRLPLPAIDHAHARDAVQLLRERMSDGELIVYDAVGWPPDWVPQFFSPMAYYGRDFKNPVLLLRDPMSEVLQAKVAEYERVFVVSPRIVAEDGLPHPSPQTHELGGKSAYIHQIGWIYLFVKT